MLYGLAIPKKIEDEDGKSEHSKSSDVGTSLAFFEEEDLSVSLRFLAVA